MIGMGGLLLALVLLGGYRAAMGRKLPARPAPPTLRLLQGGKR